MRESSWHMEIQNCATREGCTIEANCKIYYSDYRPHIRNAEGGYYIVYQLDGQVVTQSSIHHNEEMIDGLQQGLYIINVYGQGKCLQTKVIVP